LDGRRAAHIFVFMDDFGRQMQIGVS